MFSYQIVQKAESRPQRETDGNRKRYDGLPEPTSCMFCSVLRRDKPGTCVRIVGSQATSSLRLMRGFVRTTRFAESASKLASDTDQHYRGNQVPPSKGV